MIDTVFSDTTYALFKKRSPFMRFNKSDYSHWRSSLSRRVQSKVTIDMLCPNLMRGESGSGSDSGAGLNGSFNTRWLDEVVTQMKVNEVCDWAMERKITGEIEAFLSETSKNDKGIDVIRDHTFSFRIIG